MLPSVRRQINLSYPRPKLLEILQVSNRSCSCILLDINNSEGIVMGIHLYDQVTSASSESKDLRLLTAYESGGVVLRQYNRIGIETSVEGHGWDVIWKAKLHTETGTLLSL